MLTINDLPKEIKIDIKKSDKDFNVKLNEIPWMFCDVNIGNKSVWGMYDQGTGEVSDTFMTETTKRAKIHGIDCVESVLHEFNKEQVKTKEIRYYSRVQDKTLQFIANYYLDDETIVFNSIYDEEFQQNWGLEDQRDYKSNEISINEDSIFTKSFDVSAGEKVYEVIVNGIKHQCLRVIQRIKDTPDILIETYVNEAGYVILFRRYNSEKHNYNNMVGKWKETLPNANTLTVNDVEYIHWYDCISNHSVNN